MSALIGRHGHGGGGRGHGGRRFFGGGGGGWGGWGWPWPLYAYPAYPYSWQQPYSYFDVESSETVGATVTAPSPGSDGLSCEMNLDADMRLHVAICVDGRRHETSIDLSGLLCDIAEQASRAYPARMTSPAAADAAVRDVTAKVTHAVQSAGALIVGALCERHVQEVSAGTHPHVSVVSAGVWDSFTSAMSKISTPVTWFHKNVAKVIQKVPGLKQAVTAVATYYGGPLAGAAAGPLIDRSAETGGDIWAAMRGTKEGAVKKSGGDPKVAQALDHAEKAVTHVTEAYTLQQLASDADAGNTAAIGRIAEIQRAAEAGDPPAMKAMQVLAELRRPSNGVSVGATEIPVTPTIHQLRDLAFEGAAHTRTTHGSGDAVVFVFSPWHGQFSVPFNTSTEALRYVYQVDPRSISYLAVVDVSDPAYPALLHEHSFQHPTRRHPSPHQRIPTNIPVATSIPGAAEATNSGAILPLALAAAAGAASGVWWSNQAWERNLLDGALHGKTLRWNDRPIYVPAPGITPAPSGPGGA